MHIDLSGRVAIVTGAGQGIGREILSTLAREGATTVALDVDDAHLQSISDELESAGFGGRGYRCDVRDGERLRQIANEVEAEYGRIDILVNNAGVAGNGMVESLTEESWDFCFDVNLKGTFLACQAVLPAMKRQRYGRILNAASFAAIVPSVGSAAYAASKAGVVHFTRALAGEVGPWNITANSYAPGMVPTTLNHFAELPQQEQDRLLDSLSLRRWGAKHEVAELICFLASEQAGYMTGTLLDVSGGKLATQFPAAAYAHADSSGENL